MGTKARNRPAWWAIALLLIAISPLLVILLVVLAFAWLAMYVCIHCAAWCWWNLRGIDVLFVYSNSPVWQSHIESEVLPLIRTRAVVLNWSERRNWHPGLASAAFRFFGGRRDFNPLAVVFRPVRPARVFRFWQPFRDWKHGNVEALQAMEADFFRSIGLRANHTAD